MLEVDAVSGLALTNGGGNVIGVVDVQGSVDVRRSIGVKRSVDVKRG